MTPILFAFGLFASTPAHAVMPHYVTLDAPDVEIHAVVERGQLDLELDGELLSEWLDSLLVINASGDAVELSISDAVDEEGMIWTVQVTAWEGRSKLIWEEGRGEAWTRVEGAVDWDVLVVATATDGTEIKYGPVITIKPKG